MLYTKPDTGALVQSSNRRLLTLEELEPDGQFFWGDAYGTSSQEKIAIGNAMAQVFSTHRVATGLLPKTCRPTQLPPFPSGGERPTEVQKPKENRRLKTLKRNNYKTKNI